METTKILENAHKVTYLVKTYPKKTFKDVLDEKGQVIDNGIVSLLAMPAIDINSAIWCAQGYGWLGEPDPETDIMPLLGEPSEWKFGDSLDRLKETILYAFSELAKKETDLEEFHITQWLAGYPTQDMLIAMKHLLETKHLAEYELTDPKDKKSTYKFYSLFENGEQMWGRKSFKVQPDAEK